jgi:ABC-type multidrug transport system ATPase subunit
MGKLMILLCKKENIIQLYAGIIQQDWEIPSQGMSTLAGANGIGKSSLINFWKLNQKELFSIAPVFIDQDQLKPLNDLTLAEGLNLLQSFVPKINYQKSYSEKLIEDWKIRPLMDQKLNLMSGGENQLCKLVLSLSIKSPLYILDEPFNHLSLSKKEMIKQTLEELAKKSALLIIDHQNNFNQRPNTNSFQMLLKEDRLEIQTC